MEGCIQTCEYEKAFEIIDLETVHSILQFEELAEETDVFTMTSLSTMMLISQADAKAASYENAQSEGIYCDERYRLNLAYERLHSMPKLLLNELSPMIKILDISHNEFENLDFLSEFTRLTILVCDHNNITSSTFIPYMPGLEMLWMNHCKITELYPWAKRLQQSCPNLKFLSLMGNAAAPSYLNGGSFYEYLQYRLFIVSLFPSLGHLDDKLVTNDQRLEAQRMYKRPLIERLTSRTSPGLPDYLRSFTGKVSEMFLPVPEFAVPQKNSIV